MGGDPKAYEKVIPTGNPKTKWSSPPHWGWAYGWLSNYVKNSIVTWAQREETRWMLGK